ncbi:MAG: EscU/YscU/HrcU family type III secretion system export apparatus switch protein [Treponema sp.]|nr:EscU/YscU/HrcU family type III secretion system export apparatus switch protein [Treponema sp.]
MNKEQFSKNEEWLMIHGSLLIDLQWFSDDDNDEDAPGKTIDPTEQKIKKLREEGQVAKSQELTGAVGLILPALVLLILAPSMLRTCIEMIRFFFTRAIELDPTRDGIIAANFMFYFVRLVWPIMLVAVIAAIFSNLGQLGGWLFTTKPLVPKFSKALPKFGQYFKRIFSSEGGFNLFKSLAKILIIGFIAFSFISANIPMLHNLIIADPYTGLTVVASIAIRMMLVVAVVLIVLSIADVYFQRWRFKKRHMMTQREVKEEFKQANSDPEVQHRIKARFRELLKQSVATAVPKADVVITNPTHLAIALEYDSKSMEGPMVVAIGEDEMSARIREIANQHEVPLVENKPLAWALYRETTVGQIVPYHHWNAVALVLKQVWSLNEKRGRKLGSRIDAA